MELDEIVRIVVAAGFLAAAGAKLVLSRDRLAGLGMTVVAGMWGAVVATAIVLGGVVVWASLRSRTPPGTQPVETESNPEPISEAPPRVEV